MGTTEQVKTMREDWYLVAVFDGDELVRDSIVRGAPHDIAYTFWCYGNQGYRIEIGYEETGPYAFHPILEMDVDGRFEYEVTGNAEWMRSMAA